MVKKRLKRLHVLLDVLLGSAAFALAMPAVAQTTIIQQQPAAPVPMQVVPPGTVRITPEQRVLIKKRIGTVQPSATLRERVTVGTTLPPDVELTPLPEDLYAEVPTVRNYRYMMIGDEIVLVEPQTRRVIEVFPE